MLVSERVEHIVAEFRYWEYETETRNTFPIRILPFAPVNDRLMLYFELCYSRIVGMESGGKYYVVRIVGSLEDWENNLVDDNFHQFKETLRHMKLSKLWEDKLNRDVKYDPNRKVYVCQNKSPIVELYKYVENKPKKLTVINPISTPRTKCKHGHDWNAKNIYISPNGTSSCRICIHIIKTRYANRKKEKKKQNEELTQT